MTETITISTGTVATPAKQYLRAEGLTIFAASVVLYRSAGAAWWLFPALFLVPDLSMLAYLINPRAGGAAYNAVHNYVVPLAAAGLCILLSHPAPLPFLAIWIGHIGLDRALGYGLKYPDAFTHTHLGLIGKKRLS